jgi:hypothetical protein
MKNACLSRVLGSIALGDELMEVNTGTPAKRGRAKVKAPAAEVTKTAAPAKKPRATKKVTVSTVTVTTAPVVTPAVNPTVKQRPSSDELRGMIAMAAYYRAAARHFAPGQELDDWLEAERQINALFG